MKKISIMLVVTMLMSVFSFGTLSVNATGEENVITADTSWYGDGTATEFSLADASDLLGFADLVNNGNNFSGKTVKLTADIDMSGVTDFTGIGFYEYTSSDVYKAFSGTFDGNGKKIMNVTISKLPSQATSTTYVGVALFGSINGATIRNLGVENMALNFPHSNDVTRAHYDCGGFVSHAPNSNTIENCYVDGLRMNFGNAKSGLGQVGGLIGKAQGSGTLTITNTYVANFDSFGYMAGGGSVALGSFLGNIAGAKTLNITNCYAAPIERCTISVNGNVSLLNAGAAYGTCSFTNFVSVPWNDNANVTVGNVSKGGNMTSKTGAYTVTDAELKALSNANLAVSFRNAYMTDRNGGYPVSVKNCTEVSPFASGTGTEADPYIINDENSLRDFAKAVNAGYDYAGKFVKLANDIELVNGTWTPIGYYEYSWNGKSYIFKGTFDGDGHVVSNINITRASTAIDNIRKSIGFFGCVVGTVKNLGLKDVSIDLTDSDLPKISYIGALVGTGAQQKEGITTITDCYVDGFTVNLNDQGSDQYAGVGGIIGDVYEAATINGVSVRDVSYTHTGTKSGAYFGGLVGAVRNNYLTLANAYVHGFAANVGTFNCFQGQGVSWQNTNNEIEFYYVGDSGLTIAGKEGTAVTEDELKALTGNAAGLSDKFVASKYGLNDGYPILKAEKLWVFNRTGNNIALSVKGTHIEGTKLILAVYDGERFVDASIVSTGTTLATDLDLSAGAYNVKGFLWDANLSPLETIPYENTVTVQ